MARLSGECFEIALKLSVERPLLSPCCCPYKSCGRMGLDCVTFSELYLGPSVQFFELVLKVVGYDGVSVV